jgi:photosystem II stability/assembly factor-like uncharacterized protein
VSRLTPLGPEPTLGRRVVRDLALLTLPLIAACGGGGPDSTTEGGLVGRDFHSLVVDPNDPQRIFVGGHQAVSVSTDGGRSWTEIEALQNADAMGWAFLDDALYVSGHPGLRRSDDNGATFDVANERLPDTDLHALGGAGTTLYAATPSAGLITTSSDPLEWTSRSRSVGPGFFGRIVVDRDNPQQLYAADLEAGVLASNDGGQTWKRLDSGLDEAVWISRSGKTMVASSSTGRAIRSDDGGVNWRPVLLPPGAALVELADDDGTMLAGVLADGRVTVVLSRDGGSTWTAP